MIVTGKVRDRSARKFQAYCYRKPIKTRLDIYSVDPARLDPLHEYPRSEGKPACSAECKTVDLADYEAVIGPTNEKGESRLSITMLPNEYTEAEESAVVFEMTINGILPNSGFCIDEAIRCCFSDA